MFLNFNGFQRPEHQPFLWEGGSTAVLLIHGFPGSPAEVRPLAQHLHTAGFTAQGLLLPGFGPQLESLPRRQMFEWVTAAVDAYDALRRDYERVWLLGHSMGAAVALQAAARIQPDGLILLAPFWQIGRRRRQLIWRVLYPFVREFRPFKRFKPDFNDPGLRANIGNWLPDADLDDPAVQEQIRNFAVPTAVLEQLRLAGQGGYQAAPQVNAPAYVLQGRRDPLVKPDYARRLTARIPAPLHYQEIEADHDLLDPNKPHFPTVATAVLQFLQSLKNEPQINAD